LAPTIRSIANRKEPHRNFAFGTIVRRKYRV
jgi:hypothetical protein